MARASVERFFHTTPPPSRPAPGLADSRPTSKARRSSPGDRKKSKRSANDVRVNPASSEVITGLISSLSSVSLPNHNEGAPSPSVPRAGSRASQSPSPAPSGRRRNTTTTFHGTKDREPGLQSVQELKPPEPSGDQSLDAEQVAEPPVIRTARRPSGFSKVTAPRGSRRPKTSQSEQDRANSLPTTPRPTTTPLRPPPVPETLDTISRPNTPSSLTAKKQTLSARTSGEARRIRGLEQQQRDSLLLLRSKEYKGKERARDAASSSSSSHSQPIRSAAPYSKPYSSANIYAPQGRLFSFGNRPSHPKPIREDELDMAVSAPPPPLSAQVTPLGSPRPSRKVSEVTLSTGSPLANGSPDFIPTRRSSLKHSASPPPSLFPSRRSSWRMRSSPENQRKGSAASRDHAIQEHRQALVSEKESQAGATQKLDDDGYDRDVEAEDEDDKVFRRIRQLQAAREERQRGLPNGVSASSSGLQTQTLNGSPLPRQTSPPDTTRAGVQLIEAKNVEEHRVPINDEKIEPLNPIKTSFGTQPALDEKSPAEAVNFSRLKVSPVPSPTASRSQVSIDAPSRQGSPPLSRSNSRNKRWSNPDLVASASPHKKDFPRNHTALSQYPPVIEETRPSLDSVDGSVRDFLESPRLSQKIAAPDQKRTISFAEVGDPRGFAVFCCIGMGVTRYVMAFYEELATTLRLRLITPERPGVGDSTAPGEQKAPLYWPDDVQAICEHLSIPSFSLVAHSAGAIYALATALKMPSQVRGRVHLLAPWIPPSQMSSSVKISSPNTQAGTLPRSQRFLRMMPTPLLKLTNKSFMGNVARAGTKSPAKSRKSNEYGASPRPSTVGRSVPQTPKRPSFMTPRNQSPERVMKLPSTPRLEDVPVPTDHDIASAVLSAGSDPVEGVNTPTRKAEPSSDRQRRYDQALTPAVWDLATRKANPAYDLIACLERNRTIGFQYADVSREVVIHHGSKDNRVPLDNVKFLAKAMQKAELRVLEGEGHNLMGNAGVMASVLSDVGRECEAGFDGKLNDPPSAGTSPSGDQKMFR